MSTQLQCLLLGIVMGWLTKIPFLYRWYRKRNDQHRELLALVNRYNDRDNRDLEAFGFVRQKEPKIPTPHDIELSNDHKLFKKCQNCRMVLYQTAAYCPMCDCQSFEEPTRPKDAPIQRPIHATQIFTPQCPFCCDIIGVDPIIETCPKCIIKGYPQFFTKAHEPTRPSQEAGGEVVDAEQYTKCNKCECLFSLEYKRCPLCYPTKT